MATVEFKVGRRGTGKTLKSLQDAYTHSLSGSKTFIVDMNQEYELFSRLKNVYSNRTLKNYLEDKEDLTPKIYIPYCIGNSTTALSNLKHFDEKISSMYNGHKTIIIEDINRYGEDKGVKQTLLDLFFTHRHTNTSYIVNTQCFNRIKAEYFNFINKIEIFQTIDSLSDKKIPYLDIINKTSKLVNEEASINKYFSIKLDLSIFA